MADYRAKVPAKIKKALIKEAGGKCANPGCPHALTEIHHIKERCVYKTHDQSHMIAICPNCHDAVTRGGLRMPAVTDSSLCRGSSQPTNNDSIPLARLLLASKAVQARACLILRRAAAGMSHTLTLCC